MTDIVVSFALENLKNLLIHEANLFLKVEEDVKLLKDDLGIMNAFLKDSEGKRDNHYTVKELINQIRDTVFEAEDVANAYMAQVIKQRRRNLLLRLLNCFGHAVVLHQVAEKTTSVNRKIENIYANKSKFGIEAHSYVDEEAEHSLQERRRIVEEEDVVGLVDDTEKLVHQLIDPRRPQLEVISIIGMGGLGKTTLARKIYNNIHIKNHFDHCAWVNVSIEYKTKALILDIMKCCVRQLSEETYKMSNDELKVKLRGNLEGKRFLVVMDDVWNPQLWDEIRASFPNDKNGSKILITSREKEVASAASSTPPYFLPFLDKEASWELLCKKVFGGEKCLSNLESVGRQLAESCKGLPLSIVVLGGILANKEKTQQIWSDFIGNVNWFLIDDDKKRCSDILALSYNQLPRKLRLCFLYMGVFPEDFVIPARTLTQMWVAEGFISTSDDSRKMDENLIAENYLDELIDRSLIQVASKRSDGGVKTCRIHDLLRDLCIKMSIQEKFYEVHVNEVRPRSSNSKPRRHSLQGNIDSDSIRKSISYNSVSVWSLFLFPLDFDGYGYTWAFKNFRFIRLLCLEVPKFYVAVTIPKEIEQLVFLRCLRICSRYVRLVNPGSICKLPYLDTIHVEARIDGDYKHENFMPNEIWMMKQLRYFYVSDAIRLAKPPTTSKSGGYISSKLQVLSGLHADENAVILFQKYLFPNLRKLNLIGWTHNKIRYMQHVSEILASPLESLRILKLKEVGLGQHLGLFHSPSSKLTKITFAHCSCMDSSHLKLLGKLANLRILKIVSCDMESSLSQLHFMSSDFPQLEVFKMIGSSIVENWELETQAMPNLQRLVIHECDRLRNVPDQLWSLPNLRMVEVSEISQDLKDKLIIKQAKMEEDGHNCKLIIN